jgi:hypothetical protein
MLLSCAGRIRGASFLGYSSISTSLCSPQSASLRLATSVSLVMGCPHTDPRRASSLSLHPDTACHTSLLGSSLGSPLGTPTFSAVSCCPEAGDPSVVSPLQIVAHFGRMCPIVSPPPRDLDAKRNQPIAGTGSSEPSLCTPQPIFSLLYLSLTEVIKIPRLCFCGLGFGFDGRQFARKLTSTEVV